jgi:hypothetical protein
VWSRKEALFFSGVGVFWDVPLDQVVVYMCPFYFLKECSSFVYCLEDSVLLVVGRFGKWVGDQRESVNRVMHVLTRDVKVTLLCSGRDARWHRAFVLCLIECLTLSV